MAFDGDEMDYAAADDAVLDQTLVVLWSARDNDRQMDSGGLMEELMERMRPFFSEDAPEITDGVRRDRRWFYPIEALREALANAFGHGDWMCVEDWQSGCIEARASVREHFLRSQRQNWAE